MGGTLEHKQVADCQPYKCVWQLYLYICYSHHMTWIGLQLITINAQKFTFHRTLVDAEENVIEIVRLWRHANFAWVSLVFLVTFKEIRNVKENPDGQEFVDALARFDIRADCGYRMSDLVSPSPYVPGSYNNPKRCDECGFESLSTRIVKLHKYFKKHVEWVIPNFITYIFLRHNVHYSETK